MWIVFTVAGLAVELTAIVLLGRSVTRRDEERAGRRAVPAILDGAGAVIVVRGDLARTGSDVLRDAAESPGGRGHRRSAPEIPQARSADPAAGRVLADPGAGPARARPRMRPTWSAPADPPVLGHVPEPRWVE